MAAPPDAPCSAWTTDAEVRACCPGLAIGFDLDPIIQFTSALLFRLSGRQYPGECTRIVYPCHGEGQGCSWGNWFDSSWWWQYYGYPSVPYPNDDGTWNNLWPCAGRCHLDRVKLPGTINSVENVTVDGVELVEGVNFKIEAYRWLVRIDGGRWPCGNDLSGEPGDEGVWTIEYSFGKPPPPEARFAASFFACEMAKNRCGADNCLPQRLKSVSRQGVSMEFDVMADPLDFLDQGKVGIYEVDLWLRSVNPSRLKRRARLHRPDRGRTNTTFTD